MINKEIIKNNFSKCALAYDSYCGIQNLCAAKLIARIKTNTFRRILDLGCGTGNYTRLLRIKFPLAEIKALDISEAMIRVSQKKLQKENIEFIIADAENISFKEKFDLISSNATFQWFENLEEDFKKYRGFLKKNGIVLFSVFGPQTFRELGKVLEEFYQQNIFLNSNNFLDKETINQILKKFFKKVRVREAIYKKKYNSLLDLLKSIKYTGTRTEGLFRDRIWTQSTLRLIEKMYQKKFRNIVATYQVFFCEGIK